MEYISQHWIEILGVTCGLIYLYQELKASIWMWVTGIIMPCISMFVYFNAGLYADFGINIYYLLAAVYGFLVWRFGKKKDEAELPITRTPRNMYSLLAAIFIILFIAIRAFLIKFTDSTVPTWDSFTTALSIIGLWMLAHKWIEQWWVWFVVDAVSCGLYIYKGIYFYSALYGLYTVLAAYGYYRWLRVMGYGLWVKG